MGISFLIEDGIQKLRAFEMEEWLTLPSLRMEVEKAVDALVLSKSYSAEARSKDAWDTKWEFHCLQAVYALEDALDTFKIQSLLQQRNYRSLVAAQSLISSLTSIRRQHILSGEIRRTCYSIKALLNNNTTDASKDADTATAIAIAKGSLSCNAAEVTINKGKVIADVAAAAIGALHSDFARVTKDTNTADGVAIDKGALSIVVATGDADTAADAASVDKDALSTVVATGDADTAADAASVDKDALSTVVATGDADTAADAASVDKDALPCAASSSSGGHQSARIHHDNSEGESDTFGCSNIIGYEEQAKSLSDQLLGIIANGNSNQAALQLITIFGEEGFGKSSLVKRVCEKEEVKRHFEVSVPIFIGKGPFLSSDDLMRRIVYALSRELLDSPESWYHRFLFYDFRDIVNNSFAREVYNDPETIEEHVSMILGQFLAAKRYLIILEDVSVSIQPFIEQLFPDSCNGSRVIVITSSEKIAHEFPPKNRIHLLGLNFDESWNLLLKEARISRQDLNISELNTKVVRDDIWRKCGGSPLKIIEEARRLSEKHLSWWAWLNVINEDEIKIAIDTGDPSSTLDRIFDIGFDSLPDALKRCLLYLPFFPMTSEIPARRLLRLWIAEGFFDNNVKDLQIQQSEIETPEQLAEEKLEDLVRREWIEVTKRGSDGRARKCRLSDVIRSFSSQFTKSRNRDYFYHLYDMNSVFKCVRRFAHRPDMEYDQADMSDALYSSCRTYVCFNTQKRDSPTTEVGMLLHRTIGKRGFGLLRAIDLEGVYKPTLPKKLGKLLHLRYLSLRRTFLDELPTSVGDLPYLETLDVKHTEITKFPSSIWKAKNLKHLYMNEIHIDLSSGASYIKYASNLQTLWGMVISADSPIVNGLRFLTNLRKLGLTCHPRTMKGVLSSIHHLKKLESLRLRSIDEFGNPSALMLSGRLKDLHKLIDAYLVGVIANLSENEFPENLRVLTLSFSKLEQDPLPILGRMSGLRTLKLLGSSYVGEKMVCFPLGFPSLCELKLWKLENLKELKLEKGAMHQLNDLEIRCCNKLNTIDGVELLTDLKEVTLKNMSENQYLRANLHQKKLIN